MTNKRGFTDDQQDALIEVIQFAQHAAGLVTAMAAKTLDNDQIIVILRDFYDFAVATYPRGPLQMRDRMNEIAQFCDLNLVTAARSLDDDRIL